MADNKSNDKDLNVSEISDQLKNKYSEESKASEPKIKKAKTMTDDDVKALLRMYYSDRENLPAQKEPSFLIDTFDFIADDDTDERALEADTEIEPENESEPNLEIEADAEIEESVKPDAYVGTDVDTEIEPENESEPNLEIEADAEIEEDVKPDADVELEDTSALADESAEDAEFAFSLFAYDEEKGNENDSSEEISVKSADSTDNDDIDDKETDTDTVIGDEEDDFDEIIYDYADRHLKAHSENEEGFFEEASTVIVDEIDSSSISDDDSDLQSVEMTDGEQDVMLEDASVADFSSEISSEFTLEKEEIQSSEGTPKTEDVLSADELESDALVTDDGDTSDENSEKIWVRHDDVSGRLDDGELDLMVALGFGDKLTDKYGEERVRRAEAKLRLQKEHNYSEISAFGYIGKEYTKASDVPKIKDKFKKDKKLLTVRCIATFILMAVLMLVDNLELFGISSVLTQNTTVYVIVSMLLLLCAGVFSYKQLINGFLFTLERRKNGNSMLSLTFAVIIIYDIVLACMAPPSVILFDFTVSIGLVFGVLTDVMDFMREKKTFELLTSGKRGELYGLCNSSYEMGGGCVLYAGKINFAEGYFRRTSRRKNSPFLLFIALIPVALIGAFLAIAMAVGARSIDVCVSAFVSVFAFASPLSWIFGKSWQSLAVTLQTEEIGGGIIGGKLSDSNVKAKLLDFDDDMAFPAGSCEIMNVIFYENENIYKSLYYVNALFSAVGGPLKPLLSESASKLDLPKSVYLACAAEHYVEATVDGTHLVCAGSYSALKKRGVCVDSESGECPEDCTYMYAAIDNRVCARFLVRYNISDEFLKLVREVEYEGGGICIRTLDPNIDRGILLSAFGENTNTVIVREPHRELDKESSSVVSVFSRGDIGSLAYTYAQGKRMIRTERVMDIAQLIFMSLGAIVSGSMFFFNAPTYCYAAISAIMQLICVLPPIVITSLAKRKNNKKTANTES